MGLNAVNFQELLIASLSNADPDAIELLQTNVPLYWALNARQAHLPELRYWYTRREAIKLLMGCLNKQIDYMRRNQQNTRASVESSLADSTTLAESTTDSHAESFRSNISQSDSESNTTASASNSGNQSANQSQASDMFMDDTGSGANTQSRISHQRTDTKEESDVEERTQALAADNIMRHTRLPGENSGDHSLATYQNISWQGFDPATVGIALGFPIGILEKTTTESGSTTTNEVTDDVYATTKNSSSDAPIRKSTTDTIVRVVPIRSVLMSAYDVPMKADGTADLPPTNTDPNSALSRKSSSSVFTANSVSVDSNASFSGSVGRSLSESHANTDGASSAITLGEGSSLSESSGVATSVGEGTGTTTRSTQAQSQMDSMMERLNQRFKHLQELWTIANEMILWFESQRLGLTPYLIRKITTEYPAGIDAQTANRLLINAPSGVFVS